MHETAMPEAKDFLEQFEQLPPDWREQLAMRLFEVLPIPFHPLLVFKPRFTDFPSVISTPGVCGGSPRLVRTRIPIWVLQRMQQVGLSEAEILESYPTLAASDLVQAWGYAALHKAEIDREIEENERD
jgi:uncharacterized protein (DUF433 family)